MRVYVGHDPRDELAFRACVASLRKHSSISLDIYPLYDHQLRRRGLYDRPYRVTETGQMIDTRDGRPFSTLFSFTRFLVPLIDRGDDWVLFCDADFLWRKDVAKLLALADDTKAVMCVKHDHRPPEMVKMDGVAQAKYPRKNWSSLMLMRPKKCGVTREMVNFNSGSYLHGLYWQDDEGIGALPEEWNWLEGWSSTAVPPAAVHYTRGTPDMLGDKLPYADDWRAAVAYWRPGMNYEGIK